MKKIHIGRSSCEGDLLETPNGNVSKNQVEDGGINCPCAVAKNNHCGKIQFSKRIEYYTRVFKDGIHTE